MKLTIIRLENFSAQDNIDLGKIWPEYSASSLRVDDAAASKQPELAEKFLTFMVSPAFQNAIPTGNWMYPVTQVTLPPGIAQLEKPSTALEFTPQQVATQRQTWINAWQRAVSR